MSLQSRLATLISLIGADIHKLDDRTKESMYTKITRNANAAGGNDYTRTGSAGIFGAIDSTNLRVTRTCSGRPIRLSFRGTMSHNTAGGQFFLSFKMDGAAIDGGPQLGMIAASAGQQIPFSIQWDVVPTPGSHYFEPAFAVSVAAQQGVVYARSILPCQFTVEELPYGDPVPIP